MEATKANEAIDAEVETVGAPQGTSGTLSGKPLRDLDEETQPEETATGAKAVQRVAQGRGGDAEYSEAMRYFLDPEAGTDVMAVRTKRLNFGTPDNPRWIDWTVTTITGETLKAIRRRAQNTRAARQSGNVDDQQVNLEIIVACSIDPNLREVTRILADQGLAPNDPTIVLKEKLKKKPGYIPALAGEILGLSGFDEADVQDAEAVEAAKN